MARTDDLVPVWNSLVITSLSTAISMFLGTICAYSMARFRTGGDNLAIWILSQRMLPPVAIAFPCSSPSPFCSGWIPCKG